jgi:hypothetical protein
MKPRTVSVDIGEAYLQTYQQKVTSSLRQIVHVHSLNIQFHFFFFLFYLFYKVNSFLATSEHALLLRLSFVAPESHGHEILFIILSPAWMNCGNQVCQEAAE